MNNRIPLPPAAPEILASLALPFGAVADDRPGNTLEIPLTSPWLDPEDIEAFINEFYPADLIYQPRVQQIPELGIARIISCYFDHLSEMALNPSHNASDRNALAILDDILRGQPSDILRDGKVDRLATNSAIAAREAIQADFRQWLWSDLARAQKYLDRYCERQQLLKPPADRPVNLDGLALTPRPIQVAAAQRIQGGSCLLSLPVGSGKTAAAAIALQQDWQKAIFVTSASLIAPTLKEFRKVYPNFDGLVIAPSTVGDRSRVKDALRAFGKRQRGIAIVSHQTFRDCIDPAPAARKQWLQEELALTQQIVDRHDRFAESTPLVPPWRLIENLRRRIEGLESEIATCDRLSPSARCLTRLGVQLVIIDEADAYKNLPTRTRRPIAGIPRSGSAIAEDLLLKAIELEQIGAHLVLMTGSWPDNSIAELWAAAQYLDRHSLRAAGLPTFDAWLSAFGHVAQVQECDLTGLAKTTWRIGGFVNMHLLLALKRFVLFGSPPGEGDRPIVHQVVIPCEATPAQQQFLASLSRL